MLWKWKLARDCDDVLHLLNGETRYDQPVPDARVCMTWRGDHPRFWVFATKAAKAADSQTATAAWSWRSVADADGVLSVLSGDDPVVGAVAQAQIAAAWTGRERRFYVFYRRPARGQEPLASDGWEWTLTANKDEAVDLLNGGSHSRPVTCARVAAAHRDHHDDYYVFHRHGEGLAVDPWEWRSVATADEVRAAVERKGLPPLDYQVVAPPAGHGAFQLFTNRGARPTASAASGGASLLAR